MSRSEGVGKVSVTRLHPTGTDPVRALSDALAKDGPLKLWSVLVTCLGDLSEGGTPEVSGLTLSALIERIGLQPQAMRVALHRLKRDGWIDSRRDGRVGYHRLSQSGLAQTRAVAERVYGTGAAQSAPWHLVGVPPDAPDALAMLPDGVSALGVSRSFAVVSGPLADLPQDWLICAPTSRAMPPWVRNLVDEAACEVEFTALTRALSEIDAAPADARDRFALRVLVLHGWRRLILRSIPAAEAALGPARAEAACRVRVHAVLDMLGQARPPHPEGAA